MTPERYGRYTSELVAGLSSDARVLGIVALGSMAGVRRQPDRWSDHDFFVITVAGVQEEFRQRTDWLPDSGEIALHFRETAHGCKAIYDSGHLAEYAIFDVDESRLARVNDWRVLLDRERIEERMRDLAVATRETIGREVVPAAKLASEMISNLLVAAVRAGRGERLSARVYLTYAMTKFASLLGREVAAGNDLPLDTLDPTRRIEAAYPAAGEALTACLRLEESQAAIELLALARTTFPHLVAERTVAAVLRAV